MKIDGECLIELIRSCRNKVQVYRSIRMPQLHTSLHFHLTPIVMINGSSRRGLLLNSQNFCRSIPVGVENPSLSWLCCRKLWGSRNRRALILGWAYYLDAFSSYPLRTWLPSVYRGHDNWYTRGKGPLNAITPTPDMDQTVSQCSEPSSRTALMGEQPNPWNILQPQSNFYPLSDGPSTRHHQITKVDFHHCSMGESCSLAPFYLCTRGQTPPGPRKPLHASVVCIFTDISISPSLSPRKCPDRYAFRAGQNLPDKEFHYLRTVIVTAAVHRGFGQLDFLDLPALGRHTWSYDFVETCVFGKQSPGPGHYDPLCEEAPLLPKLRGYFTDVGYFIVVAPGAQTLARGIFSTPSYLEKVGKPYALTHPPWMNLVEEP
ncbi:hypothetical protein ACS0TY_033190 [Phlomoides rotata]